MMRLTLLFVAFVTILTSCATTPRGLSQKQAIAIAVDTVDKREHWAHGGDFTASCYTIDGRCAGWRVSGLEVVDPSVPRRRNIKDAVPEDARRYDRGRVTSVTIDKSGKIIYYLPGVL